MTLASTMQQSPQGSLVICEIHLEVSAVFLRIKINENPYYDLMDISL